jgi:prepilin-type N-terminal cleavage/methylation domain-containing protein
MDATHRPQRAEQRDNGFTLIELLIVVAILGVLGGVTAFAIGNLTDKAETTACNTERRTLALAIESYRATRDAWPTSMNQLVSVGLIDRASTTYELSSTSSGGVVVSVAPRAIAGGDCA